MVSATCRIAQAGMGWGRASLGAGSLATEF